MKDNGGIKMKKEYDINFSKYINDDHPNVSFWSRILAETEEEAIKRLYQIYKNINCILSIAEIENNK